MKSRFMKTAPSCSKVCVWLLKQSIELFNTWKAEMKATSPEAEHQVVTGIEIPEIKDQDDVWVNVLEWWQVTSKRG